jgi:hypothetical protein
MIIITIASSRYRPQRHHSFYPRLHRDQRPSLPAVASRKCVTEKSVRFDSIQLPSLLRISCSSSIAHCSWEAGRGVIQRVRGARLVVLWNIHSLAPLRTFCQDSAHLLSVESYYICYESAQSTDLLLRHCCFRHHPAFSPALLQLPFGFPRLGILFCHASWLPRPLACAELCTAVSLCSPWADCFQLCYACYSSESGAFEIS